jgi:hypothetical protein
LGKETDQKLNTFLGIPGCFNAKTWHAVPGLK